MNHIEKISHGTYSERQLEFERRVKEDCHQALYRKQLASEIDNTLKIDPKKGFLKLPPFAYPEIQDIIKDASAFKKQTSRK